MIGDVASFFETNNSTDPSCEYPVGSGIDHITYCALWIGALVDTGTGPSRRTTKQVTTTNSEWVENDSNTYLIPIFETAPVDTNHPWYHRERPNPTELNLCRGPEDTGAVSESEYLFEFTDTGTATIGLDKRPFRTPLGVKILQRSYAWAHTLVEPILPIEYTLINVGHRQLRQVYLGIRPEAWLGTWTESPANNRMCAGYWADLRTAYVYDPVHSDRTPIGFTILAPPKPWKELQYYSFRWFNFGNPGFDVPKASQKPVNYDALSGALYPGSSAISPNQSSSDPRIGYGEDLLFSMGPIDVWNPGDTLKMAFALVSGMYMEILPDNLHDNARMALALYARHYVPPVVLPPPKLRIEPGFRKVTLRWGYDGTGVDPMSVWDGASQSAELYPSDNWRRINAPIGCTHGGRIFGGYRLYRSEDPAGAPNSFTIMGQWDVKDSVGPSFGFQTGIETTFVDSNLVTDKTYWYAVTSYAIPDAYGTEYVDSSGAVQEGTLYATEGRESSLLEARKRVNIPFSVSHELGKVLVVPNPYRVDEDYAFENGGWEGRERLWNETKRLIKFIHLPEKCTIRIYSLAGDVVATLHHEDPSRGEIAWDLLSDSGRAIASGVYVFTVDSDLGKQIGKFVVIR